MTAKKLSHFLKQGSPSSSDADQKAEGVNALISPMTQRNPTARDAQTNDSSGLQKTGYATSQNPQSNNAQFASMSDAEGTRINALYSPTPGLGLLVPPGNALMRSVPAQQFASVTQLGELVKHRRKIMKMPQQEFADLAGVGRRFVSELENGKETLEIGKVLTVTAAAGIDLFARPR
jgi:y4mF family transcriptional regulator